MTMSARLRRRPVPAAVRPGSLGDLVGLLRLARPPRWPLVVAGVLMLGEVAGTLAFPLLTRDIVDRLGAHPKAALAVVSDPVVLRLLAILVAAAAAAATSRYLAARAGLRTIARLKAMVFARLIAAPLGYFDRSGSGEPTSRIMNDTKAVAQLVSRDTLGAGASLLLLIGAAIVLFSLDAALATILFSVIGIAFLAILPVLLTMASVTFRVQEVTARLSARLTQVFGEIRLVKTFGAELREQRRTETEIEAMYVLGCKTAAVEGALSPVMTLAVTLSMVLILSYGGMRVATGSLSSGTLTAFFLYLFTVVGPLVQISTFVSQLSAARGASSRLVEAVRAPVEDIATDESPVSQLLAVAASRPTARPKMLTFEGVRFGYEGVGRPTLDVEALEFAPGSRTAIIGASGSGKSTLLALIERFYAPDAGTIRCGGASIATIPLSAWRSQIGYVAQSSAMLPGSIRENILYGIDRPVNDAEIFRALDLAQCRDFVARLPQGIHSLVGERGVGLSGGECQRIAIARMFLRDPEILLLDEPTSQLDEVNARLVLHGLGQLMRDRTCVIVTHRLAGLGDLDRVVTLDDGRIVPPRPALAVSFPPFAGPAGERHSLAQHV